ncbi:sensor histidine kinase [Insolitispirillum peregrinum]|uniref:histidine kinase n=1 Tax=Insolitispirillum peregrinum TaxID=80876 RepID=A0A1N7L5V0_9PROT|nr:HAMP domain-containing sensor histidine kinase [Insolitispirillum peregrinum]SIS69245.1 Signal transduction histidine kinase [Insolitispirillum peregrinum]
MPLGNTVRALLGTSSFRQTGLIVLAFLLVALASVLLSRYLIEHLLRAHVTEIILSDIKTKVQTTNLERVDKVLQLLRHREHFDPRKERESFLVDASGLLLVGDEQLYSALKPQLPPCSASDCPSPPLSLHTNTADLLGMRVRLQDGGQYISAYDIRPMLDKVRMIPLAAGSALFAVLLAALLIGLRFSSLTLRRVDAINRALARYSGGCRDARVPTGPQHDEFARLGSEVNHALDRIDRLVEEVRSTSGHIAHELRTPLTRLQTRLVSLADQTTGGVHDELLSAVEEVGRIYQLSRAILRLGEIETGRCQHHATALDAGRLLQEVADYYQPLAEQQQCVLRVDAPASCLLYGDQALLFQALSNLLDNALKYAPGQPIELVARRDGGNTLIGVRDHGPGIAPTERAVALQRFRRLNNAHDRPGDGLGLPLVKAVAELHRGGLVFTLPDSEPVAGLTVLLRLRGAA